MQEATQGDPPGPLKSLWFYNSSSADVTSTKEITANKQLDEEQLAQMESSQQWSDADSEG